MVAGVATHPGRVRERNEDSALHTDRFAVVADGLGGHAAGEQASRLAVERIAGLAERPDARPGDVLQAIADANSAIVQAARADPELAGMGTTLSGVGLVNVGGSEHWIVFNVGDSRVYRLSRGELTQVTVDHSEAEELRAAGQLSAEEARQYRRRNVVTRSLGTLPAPEPDSWVFPPGPDDRFVVCSDGLTGEVPDDDIADVLAAYPDPQEAADLLVERALSAGGRDNVTAIVVALEIIPAGSAVDGDTAPRIRHAP